MANTPNQILPEGDRPWQRVFPRMYDDDVGNRWPLDVHGYHAGDPLFMSHADIRLHFNELWNQHFYHDPSFLLYEDFFHDLFLGYKDQEIRQERMNYIGPLFKFPWREELRPGPWGASLDQAQDPGVRKGPTIDSLRIYRIEGMRLFGETEFMMNVIPETVTKDWPTNDRHIWRQKMWDWVMNPRDYRRGKPYRPLPPAPMQEALGIRAYNRPAFRPSYDQRRAFGSGGDFYLDCYSYISDTEPHPITHSVSAMEYDYNLAKHERALSYFGRTPTSSTYLLQAIAVADTISELEFRDQTSGEINCCSICHGEWKLGERVARLLSCHHFYHKNCIMEWSGGIGDSCPLCRMSFRGLLNVENGVDDREVWRGEYPPTATQIISGTYIPPSPSAVEASSSTDPGQ